MIKDILNKEHSGSTAIETVILTPLIFGTFMILLYFLFIILAYITYGNIANTIAHEMNMRQSGYKNAVAYYSAEPRIYSSAVSDRGKYFDTGGTKKVQIKFQPNNKYVKAGTYYAIEKTKRNGQYPFSMPFTEVTAITVNSSKPLNFDSSSGAKAASGAVISVSIDFKVVNALSVFNQFSNNNSSSLFTITVKGYSVIL